MQSSDVDGAVSSLCSLSLLVPEDLGVFRPIRERLVQSQSFRIGRLEDRKSPRAMFRGNMAPRQHKSLLSSRSLQSRSGGKGSLN